ncbi:MAG TPA: presenilin family intramembrane aspartyl protease [Candidatus Binatia bacterium]|nr:presenilin family intramembrane aspartyl protease [Candidatus Binatia bacterium]
MKHQPRIVLWLIILFLAAQYLGLFVVNQYIDYPTSLQTGNFTAQPLPTIAGQQIERPAISESSTPWYIITAVIIGTLFLFLLMRWNAVFVWKLWFFLAATVCLHFTIYALTKNVLGSTAVSLAAAIVFAWWKVWRPGIFVQNFTELLLYGGLAAVFFSILNIRAMLVLLVLISLYDAYAVWKSKHMISLAKFQSSTGLFAGLFLPYKPATGQFATEGTGVKTAILGGGDIGFPLLFAASVLKEYALAGQGWLALLIPPFAAVALALLLWLGKKDRFYPAMPFISAGCLIGIAVVWVIQAGL